MAGFRSPPRFAIAVLLALALLGATAPSVSADDTQSSASTLTDGSTSSDSVDADGDTTDWWKIYAINGDQVRISVNTCCESFFDGYDGTISLHDSAGTQLTEQSFSNDQTGRVISTSVTTSDWIYFRIKATPDGWFSSNFDYDLNPQLVQTNRDTDGDGVVDFDDDCDNEAGTSDMDRMGCPDADGDGYSDIGDAFDDEPTQWHDSDGDTYGDNPAPAFQPDSCPTQLGHSIYDRFGCPDGDGDRWSDPDPTAMYALTGWNISDGADAFHQDPTQWKDSDSDGYGDNWADMSWGIWRNDSGIGQWVDNATQPDFCPLTEGYSTEDRYGCPDSDGDHWSDPDGNWTYHPENCENSHTDCADAFPNDGSQWADRDLDNRGDNPDGNFSDAFPDNPTQWDDSDGDGYGDNTPDDFAGAWQADNFSDDATQWSDYDGDGFGDNQSGNEPDSCLDRYGSSMHDRYGCPDTDGDGYSNADNTWLAHPAGFADAFPNEITQWHDVDGDGFGDNLADGAWQPDSCPATHGESYRDRWGCPDMDGDGASDPQPEVGWLAHPTGEADAFETDPTQWADTDGDGYGDNQADGATTPDRCKDEPGTSREDRHGCPDSDNDGFSDYGDRFKYDPSQWVDSDGDGYGDNEGGHQPDDCPFEEISLGVSVIDRLGCPDTDGDGYSDADDSHEASPTGMADAFPLNRLQWSDMDGDGFGDNPMGSLRDDCPDEAGTSYIDLQGCKDSNSDGYSDSYGSVNAHLAMMAEKPTSSLFTFLPPLIIFILSFLAVTSLRGQEDDENVA